MSAQKRQPDPTGMSLEALQSRSERLGEWISANPAPILGVFGTVLVVALVIGLLGASRENRELASAERLADAQRDFRVAMGAEPGAVDFVEPANPEAARAAREAGVEQLQAVIDEDDTSSAAALAALDQGDLLVGLGRSEQAIATWKTATEKADGALQGMLLQRIAAETEVQGLLGEAAAIYARAGEIESHPLRYLALAESARLRAASGESEAAVALFQRLEADAPEFAIPEHIAAQLREIRALQSQ